MRKKQSDKNRWIKFSKDLRSKQPYCSVCGKKETVQIHHLLSWRNYKQYRFEPLNLVICCAGCHKWSRQSFEDNCVWASNWLMNNRPEQYQWVMEHM